MHIRLRPKLAVCIILGTMAVALVIMLLLMLTGTHHNTYTNAWFV